MLKKPHRLAGQGRQGPLRQAQMCRVSWQRRRGGPLPPVSPRRGGAGGSGQQAAEPGVQSPQPRPLAGCVGSPWAARPGEALGLCAHAACPPPAQLGGMQTQWYFWIPAGSEAPPAPHLPPLETVREQGVNDSGK